MRNEGNTRRSGVAALVAAWVGLAPGSLGAQEGVSLSAVVDSIAGEAVEAEQMAGMSVGVLRGTDTLHLATYGYADLELSVETPEDAVYEIGSVTKQFTAAAVLLLVEEGKLSLDDDLTKWLPDYPSGGRSIPVRRLMDHTSGIRGYTEMPVFRTITTQAFDRDTLIALFSAEPFDFEPGDALIYNNSAYFLLGEIIEAASGISYEEFIETRVFEPLGMTDSRYCHKDELIHNRAEGYQIGPDGLRPADYLNHLWPYSAGSLCSTVRDLLIWNQALHGDGEGGDLLPPELYREMITPGTLNDGTPVRYAKGLSITERGGAPRITHGGGIFGYLSDAAYFPEQDLTIVVLINTAGPVGPAGIRARIEDALFGPEPELPGRSFGGDLAQFAGRYRGAARGRRLLVTVSVEDRQLMVRIGDGEAEGLSWLGGDTFGRDQQRLRFLRRDGDVTGLQLDRVGGLYVLEKL